MYDGINLVPLHDVETVFGKFLKLGNTCSQICHLGRYIIGYMVGNLVLRLRVSGAIKHDFGLYIRQYTSPNEKFIPILLHFCNFVSIIERYKPHK